MNPPTSRFIEATAGSGKTTLMIQELVSLVTQKNVPPESCLAITFTDKAAHEMKERLTESLHRINHPQPLKLVERMTIETIHAFCARLLKKYALHIDLSPHFTIYKDMSLRTRLITHLTHIWGMNQYDPPDWLCDCLSRWSMDTWIDIMIAAYNQRLSVTYWQEHNSLNVDYFDAVSPDDMADYQLASQSFHASFNALITRMDQDKHDNRWMDYDDVLYKTYQLLSHIDWIRHDYQHQLRHIFVDEFQDTSPIQWKIIHQLCSDTDPYSDGKLWIVGDRCQAIYSFRGADDQLIQHVAATEHPRLMHTPNTNNYRSHPAMIRFINALFSRLFADQEASFLTMDPKNDHLQSASIHCHLFNKDIDELTGLLTIIRHRDSALPLHDVAILVRTHKQASVVKKWLDTHQIPAQIAKESGLANQDIIQVIMAFIHGLLDTTNLVAWYGILTDILGVSDAEFYALTTASDSFIDAVQTAHPIVTTWLTSLHVGAPFNALCDLIWQLPLSANAPSLIQAFLSELSDHWQLVNGHVPAIIDWLNLGLASPNTMSIPSEPSLNHVQIMTIHAAKGLEFSMVIVPFLHKQLNMGSQDKLLISPSHGLGFSMPAKSSSKSKTPTIRSIISESKKPASILEELRLFYVTLTRAKQHLYLTGKIETKKVTSRLRLLAPYLIHKPDANHPPDLCDTNHVFDFDYTPVIHAPSPPTDSPTASAPPSPSSTHPVIPRDVPAYHPHTPISVSDMLDLMACPKRMLLRKHRPIELIKTEVQKDGDRMHQQISHALLHGQKTATSTDPEWLRRMIESSWYQTCIQSGHRYLEWPFEYTAHNAQLKGRFDLVWVSPCGQTFQMIEFKRSISPLTLPRYERQIQIYSHLFQALHPTPIALEKAMIIDAQTNTVHPVAVSPINMDQWLIDFINTGGEPNPSACHNCEFNPHISHCDQSPFVIAS